MLPPPLSPPHSLMSAPSAPLLDHYLAHTHLQEPARSGADPGERSVSRPAGTLEQFLNAADVALIVVLHAFKSGAVLDQAADLAHRCTMSQQSGGGGGGGATSVPVVLVLGGTDVNVDAGSAPDKAATLTRRAAAVDCVVAFATSMVEAAPPGSLPERSTCIIPQGVALPPSPADAAAAADATAATAATAAMAAMVTACGGFVAAATVTAAEAGAEEAAEAVNENASDAAAVTTAVARAAGCVSTPQPSPPQPPPPSPLHSQLPPTLHEALHLPRSVPVLLLPAGLRPVKDVLWAVDAIERAAASACEVAAAAVVKSEYPRSHSIDDQSTAAASDGARTHSGDYIHRAAAPPPWLPPFVLAVVGPTLDADYAVAVAARLRWSPTQRSCSAATDVDGTGAARANILRGSPAAVVDADAAMGLERPPVVVLLPPVDRAGMVGYMRDAAAVVNTSTSEGQSGALLEAAAVGTPIVARDIPGNRSLLDLIHGAAVDAGSTASKHVSTTASEEGGYATATPTAATAEAAAARARVTTPASFANVSYGDSSSRDSRDSRGSVLALDSYEVHPCGVLCPTPESFAAAIVDALTPGGSTAVAAVVTAAAARAQAGAAGLAAFERSSWTSMVRELVGARPADCRD
uniref:Glycosyl transferase family 1 domain-containing protein n=1 Tax=Mantoniella antarctica TaxID=81844 RepID=A0A7S0S6S8_9CHLO|mmetsp:Transcript_10912/g.26711  ORF Transcript_10912/g.26711 Transcript_10912/m.26711 type:complete len:636 (+) Transcript_10912:842-2749(+)